MSANKAILDHVAIDHVQKDFTAWVANKLAFHVLQVITYNFTVQNINEITVSRSNEQCAKNSAKNLLKAISSHKSDEIQLSLGLAG